MIVVEPVGSTLVLELFTDGDEIPDDACGDEVGNVAIKLPLELERGRVVEDVVGNVVGNSEPLVVENVGSGAVEESSPGTVLLAAGDEVESPVD